MKKVYFIGDLAVWEISQGDFDFFAENQNLPILKEIREFVNVPSCRCRFTSGEHWVSDEFHLSFSGWPLNMVRFCNEYYIIKFDGFEEIVDYFNPTNRRTVDFVLNLNRFLGNPINLRGVL